MTKTVSSILNYEGCRVDVAINYVALIFSFFPSILQLYYLPLDYGTHIRYLWLPLVSFLFAFQIELCLNVGCSGISIVWSALCGFNIFLYLRIKHRYTDNLGHNQYLHIAMVLSTVYSTIAWVYYAIVSDALTTIAHICAILLGVIFAILFEIYLNRFYPSKREFIPLLS